METNPQPISLDSGYQNPESEHESVRRVREIRLGIRNSLTTRDRRAVACEEQLYSALANMIDRASDHPELVDLLQSVLGQIADLSSMGHSLSGMNDSARQELTAVLLGTSMMLERERDDISLSARRPESLLRDGRRFLELVDRRVGYVDHSSGQLHLRMTVDDKQSDDEIIYEK